MSATDRPPTLAELQRGLAARVLPPEQGAALGGAGALLDWLRLPEGADPEVRVGVYANGYPARIHESLAETFPAVAHVLGPRAFDALVHRYIAAVPLSSYNLNEAGSGLPRFLKGDELQAALPFLPDLAELEWRLAEAFHADENEPVDPAPLASWPLERWASATLRFQPSLALVRSAWPIVDVWNHREVPTEKIDIDLNDRPQNALVYRRGLAVRCDELARGEAEVLASLLAGRPLGEVGALAAEQDECADVSALFAAWMQAGLVTAVAHS